MTLGVACVLLVVGQVTLGQEAVNYEDQDNWPGVCKTGEKQSPIDIKRPEKPTIMDTVLVPVPAAALAMKNLNGLNDICFSFPNDTTMDVPALNNQTVTLKIISLHWGADATESQHTVDGEKYVAELYVNGEYTDSDGKVHKVSMTRLLKEGNGTADEDRHAEVEAMLTHQAATDSAERDIASLTLTSLFPTTISEVLVYNGSNTLPPCSETVTWIVVPEPVTVSTEQLQKLRTTKLGDGTGRVLASTSRSTQPSNNRNIQCIMREAPKDGKNSAAMVTYSCITILVLLQLIF